jgi:hypothetical protein
MTNSNVVPKIQSETEALDTVRNTRKSFEKLFDTYVSKLARLEDLRANGRYGYQLRMPKKAVQIAHDKLAEFCQANGIDTTGIFSSAETVCPVCGFVGGCECAFVCEGCEKAYAPDGLCRECLSVLMGADYDDDEAAKHDYDIENHN